MSIKLTCCCGASICVDGCTAQDATMALNVFKDNHAPCLKNWQGDWVRVTLPIDHPFVSAGLGKVEKFEIPTSVWMDELLTVKWPSSDVVLGVITGQRHKYERENRKCTHVILGEAVIDLFGSEMKEARSVPGSVGAQVAGLPIVIDPDNKWRISVIPEPFYPGMPTRPELPVTPRFRKCPTCGGFTPVVSLKGMQYAPCTCVKPDPYQRFRDAMKAGKRVFHDYGDRLVAVTDITIQFSNEDLLLIEGVDIPTQPSQGLLDRNGVELTGECRVPVVGDEWISGSNDPTSIGRDDCANPDHFAGRRWIVKRKLPGPANKPQLWTSGFLDEIEWPEDHFITIPSRGRMSRRTMMRNRLIMAIFDALPKMDRITKLKRRSDFRVYNEIEQKGDSVRVPVYGDIITSGQPRLAQGDKQ